MIIAGGKLTPDSLADQVVIVTGGGGGIGFEAARSLLWLGATVVIAELDVAAGRAAASQLASEASSKRVAFVPTDVGDVQSVESLIDKVAQRFQKVDAVINNATYAPAGATVAESRIEVWDRSYAVNLRGPALLAEAVLPGMLARKRGVFVCVSSTGGPFLAPYETFKAAQVALANSLDAELSGTGVIAFTIGPGLVPTQTAKAAIELIAPRLGMTVDQFWTANSGAVLSVEAAGAGFAAAVAMAERYSGQEISSSQALTDAGIAVPSADGAKVGKVTSDTTLALRACALVHTTLTEQSKSWQERSFFERQWMLRDFKQHAGMPVERCLETLAGIESRFATGEVVLSGSEVEMLDRLSGFYKHMGELAAGYVKDPKQREQQLRIVGGWKSEVENLRAQVTLAAA